MPNLPENTTYGSPKTSLSSSAISRLEKSLKPKLTPATPTTSPTTTIAGPSALSRLNQTDFSLYGAKPESDQTNAPLVNQPYIPYSGTPLPKTSPLAGYSSFKPLVSQSDKEFYTAPTGTAQLRNWPEALGGGQYTIDSSIDKNKAMYSDRVLFNEKINPGARAKILGDLPSNMYEVEHNIPLWAGGTDSLENIGIYDIPLHQQKTAVQSVPLTLWRNGLIDLNQARSMAFTWKDKDATGLPTAAELDAGGGLMDVNTAKKFAQKWSDDINKPSLWKNFKESWGENMQNFGKNLVPTKEEAPIAHEVGEFAREAGKGFIGGVTAGIVPSTEQSTDSGLAGWLGHTLGTGIGFVTGLGKFKLGLKAAEKGVKTLLGISKAEKVLKGTEIVLKSNGILPQAAKPIIDVGAESAKWLANKKVAKMVGKNFVDMSLFNQFGLGVRELTGQEEFDLGNHTNQAINDLKYAALTGIWGQSAAGYAGVTGSVTVASLIDGSSIEDALKEGVTMAAFHTMGAKGRFKFSGASTLRAEMIPQLASEQAFKRGQTTVRQYLGDQSVQPTLVGSRVSEKITYDPNYYENLRNKYINENPHAVEVKNLGPIRTQEQVVNFLDTASKAELKKSIISSGNEIPQEQVMKEMNRITASTRELYKRTLDPEARKIEDQKDIESILKLQQAKNKRSTFDPRKLVDATVSQAGKIKDNLQRTVSQDPLSPQIETSLLRPSEVKTSQDVLNALNYEGSIVVPPSLATRYANTKFIEEGTTASRGATEKVNKTVNDNLREVEADRLNKTNRFGDVFIVSDAESKKYIRQIKTLEEYAGKSTHMDPENTLRYFIAEMKDGKVIGYRDLGYVAEPFGLDPSKNPQSINTLIVQIGDRFKKIIADSTSPQDLQARAKKDTKSGLSFTNEQAAEIFANKEAYLNIPSFDLAKQLNTTNLPSVHTIDNAMVSKVMRENDLSAIPVTLRKINKSTTSGNSYADFIVNNDSFLRGIALKESTRAETPVKQPDVDTKQPTLEATRPVEAPLVPNAVETPKLAIQGFKERFPVGSKVEYDSMNVGGQRRTTGEVLGHKVDPTTGDTFADVGRNMYASDMSNIKRIDTPEVLPVIKSKASAYAKPFPTEAPTPVEAAAVKKPVTPVETATEEFYNDIIDKIEYSKPDVSSPKNHERALMDIVKGFKRKNPGLSDKEFKTALETAKGRATSFVERTIDDTYKGQALFGTSDEMYARELTPEKDIRKDNSQVLAEKFGLQMTEPNESGKSFLKLDKSGEPLFTEEFKRTNQTNQKPTDFWGRFLKDEMKVYKGNLSKDIKDWSSGIAEMKKSKSPYGQGLALALDTAMKEKYAKGSHGYEGSWTANAALRNAKKNWFEQYNQEGQGISQPFRNTAAITAGKDYSDISEAVARANKKTREISSEAAMARSEALANDPKALTLESVGELEGMSGRIKDPNQIVNVTQDLTPFDIMTNGLINIEARQSLISQYNALRKEMGSGLAIETTKQKDGTIIPGTADTMKLLFAQIKKLSANIPEETKKWKLGDKITLKNDNPTFDEGVKDGLRIAASIFGTKKTTGYVDFKKIRESLKSKKPDGQGGPYEEGQGISAYLKEAIKGPFGSRVVNYNLGNTPTSPEIKTPSYNIRGINVGDTDVNEAADILYGEISNRPGKAKFETQHVINTAINRALNDPKRYGGSLTKVLQSPYQYQAYAPEGMNKGGKVIESQYQKIKRNAQDIDQAKLQEIKDALNEMKAGKVQDTTGGKTFYVHASDGSLWLGATQDEAKNAATTHEKQNKLPITPWGTATGLPAQLAKR